MFSNFSSHVVIVSIVGALVMVPVSFLLWVLVQRVQMWRSRSSASTVSQEASRSRTALAVIVLVLGAILIPLLYPYPAARKTAFADAQSTDVVEETAKLITDPDVGVVVGLSGDGSVLLVRTNTARAYLFKPKEGPAPAPGTLVRLIRVKKADGKTVVGDYREDPDLKVPTAQ